MFDTTDKYKDDVSVGRHGEWMHTSLGGRFYPDDPIPAEVFISDVANGLALDCRYAGQGRVDRYYSVAEHSALMARYARDVFRWPSNAVFATLLHDAHEAYTNDLNVATKRAVNRKELAVRRGKGAYSLVADKVQLAILKKYDLVDVAVEYEEAIKDLDIRMVQHEKARIMRHITSWCADKSPPLPGMIIRCLDPVQAKKFFITTYWEICSALGIDPEEVEI